MIVSKIVYLAGVGKSLIPKFVNNLSLLLCNIHNSVINSMIYSMTNSMINRMINSVINSMIYSIINNMLNLVDKVMVFDTL